ncbi:hypothetical protein Tco_0992770 [Tanacetum coccineum]|uniref:Uncharacterized protein n=1 Tax=Tanacetum coccineum TaxID=301880 RepID=A0ABQ5F318_9ASTR
MAFCAPLQITTIAALMEAVILHMEFLRKLLNPQLNHEDLQQIHPDDMEEMDLRWQMAIPKWSATTATRGDILLGSAELQEIKTARTKKAQEGAEDGLYPTHGLTHLQVLTQSLNKLIECQIVDNCKKGLGYENYNAVPPPYTRNFMPPTPDLSFTNLDEFANKHVVEKSKAMSSEEEPKVVKKNDDVPIIEE